MKLGYSSFVGSSVRSRCQLSDVVDTCSSTSTADIRADVQLVSLLLQSVLYSTNNFQLQCCLVEDAAPADL